MKKPKYRDGFWRWVLPEPGRQDKQEYELPEEIFNRLESDQDFPWLFSTEAAAMKAKERAEMNVQGPKLVTKTYTVTAPPDTLHKFETFLALLHYNGGHTGNFGMPFDGDGHERLKVDPPPHESLRSLVDKIGGTGAHVELALCGAYKGIFTDFDRGKFIVDANGSRRER